MSKKLNFVTNFNNILHFIKVILIILVIIFLYLLIDWGRFKGEITSYTAVCDEKVINNNCYGFTFTDTTTYKVLPNRQEVIIKDWLSGPKRLTKCAVIDRTNWKCKYDDESAEFGFVKGKYTYLDNPNNSNSLSSEFAEKEYYMSRLEWLIFNIKSWLIPSNW